MTQPDWLARHACGTALSFEAWETTEGVHDKGANRDECESNEVAQWPRHAPRPETACEKGTSNDAECEDERACPLSCHMGL